MQTTIDREQAAIKICSELNQFVDLKNTLIGVMDHVKKLSNVEAVSIRLYAGGDYPYYVYNGFSESFILKENHLCPRNKNGEMIQAPTGKGYLLDCMCGNIIQGRTNPALNFFTQKGSFWSNNTTHLLKTTTNEERQANTRNYCNSFGYESVALIPIKNKTGIIGLIQLNDKKVGKFILELIHFMEMIGEQIGVAVESALRYEGLFEKQKSIFNKFIRDIIQSIGLSFNKEDIKIKLPSPDDYSIKSIPSCIYQIISNLVINSYIHRFESSDSGTITIQCSNDDESYTVQYFDDGAGIQSEMMNKIFEPFYTTKKKTNSGLGLSIVYNIINTQLGGTMRCKSTPGEGTQFLIKFPE